MISLVLDPSADTGRCYRLAGHRLVTDYRHPALDPFETAAPEALSRDSSPEPRPPESPIFDGCYNLAGRDREVACWRDGGAYWLEIAESGLFTLSGDGARVAAVRLEEAVPDPLLAETVLGPVILLALALRGTFGLHASSLVRGKAAVAFLGESGAGKSTLASVLGAEKGAWRSAGDDLLPVALEGDHPVASPQYPQLKLTGRQWGADLPEELPLAAIYLLETRAAGAETEPEVDIRLLPAREAALALVRHTFVSGLFDRALLARHLDFCTRLAARVPTRRLRYPRRMDLLPEITRRLERELTG